MARPDPVPPTVVQWGSLLLPPVDRSLERPLVRPLTRDLGRGLEALSGRATVRRRRVPGGR